LIFKNQSRNKFHALVRLQLQRIRLVKRLTKHKNTE